MPENKPIYAPKAPYMQGFLRK